MKIEAEIKAIGYADGQEMARESGSNEAGSDGWDGMLINAIGNTRTRELLGLTGDANLADDPAYQQALGWYCEGAQEGADAEVGL